MTKRVITIKKVGNANNVMYRDVLVGCFEDGDTETLAMIIDGAIDIYIARQTSKADSMAIVREACEKVADIAYEMGQKGHNKSILKRFIAEKCTL
jgi:hypothetical protein